MSGPIYGGESSLIAGTGTTFAFNEDGTSDIVNDSGERQGIYANHPAATPKYNPSSELASTIQSQARMFIEVPSAAVAKRIRAALPERAKAYADAFLQVQSQSAGRVYVDFLLQSVSEPLAEKVQVTEVLSDTYVSFFFGQRAPMWSYSGAVLNTQQNQWYDAWHIVYHDLIRGTRTSEIGYPVVIQYDTRRVIGSITASNTSLTAQNELYASLQFQLLVKEVQFSPDLSATPTKIQVAVSSFPSRTFDGQTGYSTVMIDTIEEQRTDIDMGTYLEATASDVRAGGDSTEVGGRLADNYYANTLGLVDPSADLFIEYYGTVGAEGPLRKDLTTHGEGTTEVKLDPNRTGPGGAVM
jgi:hypothetical protein